MTMTTLTKAALTGLIGSVALAAAAPAQAHDRGDDAAIAVGAGIVGLAVGAAIASDQPYYNGGYYSSYYSGPAYYQEYYPAYPAYGYYYNYPAYRSYRPYYHNGYRGYRGYDGYRGYRGYDGYRGGYRREWHRGHR